MEVRKAIIPAAGYGTRFLPITKGVPKEMLPIVDKPALQYNIEEAYNAGIKDIIIIVSKGKKAIEEYFGPSEIYDNIPNRTLLKDLDKLLSEVNLHYVLQEPMRGNGDAVLRAKELIGNEPFAVLFGDDVIFTEKGKPNATKQLIDAYNKTGKSILGVQETTLEVALRCACMVTGKKEGRLSEVLDLIEKPSIDEIPSQLASFGRFVLTPETFYELENAPLLKNEIYLTVAIQSLLKKQGGYCYDFEGIRYDMGNKLGFCEANIEYCLRTEEFGPSLKAYLKELVKGLD